MGGNDVSYGARPDPARYGGRRTWREIFFEEVRPQLPDADWARVHFLGNIPYPQFVALLQLSSVHVYLTYPFVLSWSLLEAMSVGCAIVAGMNKGTPSAPGRSRQKIGGRARQRLLKAWLPCPALPTSHLLRACECLPTANPLAQTRSRLQ